MWAKFREWNKNNNSKLNLIFGGIFLNMFIIDLILIAMCEVSSIFIIMTIFTALATYYNIKWGWEGTYESKQN